ncbi:MAG: ABC transporter ATP-binding protein [Thermoleophilia bacterium]
MSEDKIVLRNLAKEFFVKGGVVRAVDGVDLNIREGEFVCIVGPSGCGKTTLLRILAGLETATSGEIQMAHRDAAKPLNSMVFQDQSVFPWMSVRKNIAFGLECRKVDKKTVRTVVDRYIDMVGLTRFADAYPFQLSGGMKQRVSVARAFANDPEILLMDEPFAALDEQNKMMLQEELLRIWEGSNKTVVFITHSIDEALILADRVIVMTSSPGKFKAEVPVDLPRPRRVEQLRRDPQFNELFARVWSLLKDEVAKAKEREGYSRAAAEHDNLEDESHLVL